MGSAIPEQMVLGCTRKTSLEASPKSEFLHWSLFQFLTPGSCLECLPQLLRMMDSDL